MTNEKMQFFLFPIYILPNRIVSKILLLSEMGKHKIFLNKQDKFCLFLISFFVLKLKFYRVHFSKILLNFLIYCHSLSRLYDGLLHFLEGIFQGIFLRRADVHEHISDYYKMGDWVNKLRYNLVNFFSYLLSNLDGFFLFYHKLENVFFYYNNILPHRKHYKTLQYFYDIILQRISFYKINIISQS